MLRIILEHRKYAAEIVDQEAMQGRLVSRLDHVAQFLKSADERFIIVDYTRCHKHPFRWTSNRWWHLGRGGLTPGGWIAFFLYVARPLGFLFKLLFHLRIQSQRNTLPQVLKLFSPSRQQ